MTSHKEGEGVKAKCDNWAYDKERDKGGGGQQMSKFAQCHLWMVFLESLCVAYLGIIENSFIRNVAAWGLVELLLLLLLLLSIQGVWGDNQVFGLLGVQVSVALHVIAVAGVDRAVVGETAWAVGRVDIRPVTVVVVVENAENVQQRQIIVYEKEKK